MWLSGKIQKYLGLWSLGLGLSFCSLAHAQPVKFSEQMSDPSKPILVTDPNGDFMIRLTSNPTTGYSWFLVNNPELQWVKPLQHQYIVRNSRFTGVPGYEEWHFRIEPEWRSFPQVLYVTLQYLRPWMGVQGKPVVFTIVVVPPPAETTPQPAKPAAN